MKTLSLHQEPKGMMIYEFAIRRRFTVGVKSVLADELLYSEHGISHFYRSVVYLDFINIYILWVLVEIISAGEWRLSCIPVSV